MNNKVKSLENTIIGKTIGEVWINLVKIMKEKAETSFDESRERIALQCVRIKSETQIIPDPKIEKYYPKEELTKMIDMVFNEPVMVDIDKNPSFRGTPKSYYQRIKEGRMLDFVVRRLTTFPESKKAVIVFPTYEDYKQVLESPNNDYLPCLVGTQFRMIDCEFFPKRKGQNCKLHTIFWARSMDAFQKMPANLWTMVMLSQEIAKRLSVSLNKKIELDSLDGFITDAHIYNESYKDVEKFLAKIK